MTTIELKCVYCKKTVVKYEKEVRRQLSKNTNANFFWDTKCGAKYNNALRLDRRVLVEKTCQHCGKFFKALTGSKSPVFCSRSCASAGSMSEERREAQRVGGLKSLGNLVSVVATMKKREHWKYTSLVKFLDLMGEDFEFEFSLDNYIYDLLLKERKLFIEFDSDYHEQEPQKEIDRIKERVARKNGFNLIRIKTPCNVVISPELMYEIIKPK